MLNFLRFSLLFVWLGAAAQPDRLPLFASFDGTKIHYESEGDGPAVVLVHGYIVNSASQWGKSALKQTLAEAGYRVITLDLRGNGRSDKPHELANYENDAETRDITELMKFLGIKKYAVVGYSRGSIITARLLRLDKNVKVAVLGGMGADFTNPTWSRPKAFMELFSGKAHLHPELMGALEYAQRSGADTLVLGILQRVQPYTSAQDLGKIRVPVLVISGSEDQDNGNAAELAALPRSTLATVPGNHNNTSGTSAFADEILRFLKRNYD